MDYSVYGAYFGNAPGRNLLFCRSSCAAAPGLVGEDERNGLKQQEAQLLSWMDNNVTDPGYVTIISCTATVGMAPILKRLKALRGNGFRTIVVATGDEPMTGAHASYRKTRCEEAPADQGIIAPAKSRFCWAGAYIINQ